MTQPRVRNKDWRRSLDPCALTQAEAAVMPLLARGLLPEEIALALGLKRATIERRILSIRDKLGGSISGAVEKWQSMQKENAE